MGNSLNINSAISDLTETDKWRKENVAPLELTKSKEKRFPSLFVRVSRRPSVASPWEFNLGGDADQRLNISVDAKGDCRRYGFDDSEERLASSCESALKLKNGREATWVDNLECKARIRDIPEKPWRDNLGSVFQFLGEPNESLADNSGSFSANRKVSSTEYRRTYGKRPVEESSMKTDGPTGRKRLRRKRSIDGKPKKTYKPMDSMRTRGERPKETGGATDRNSPLGERLVVGPHLTWNGALRRRTARAAGGGGRDGEGYWRQIATRKEIFANDGIDDCANKGDIKGTSKATSSTAFQGRRPLSTLIENKYYSYNLYARNNTKKNNHEEYFVDKTTTKERDRDSGNFIRNSYRNAESPPAASIISRFLQIPFLNALRSLYTNANHS